MVKLNDPRQDSSGAAMRYYRSNKMYSIIKNTLKKDKKLKDKIKFKHDLEFNNDFNETSTLIKEELIFLWEEIGDLNEKIEQLQNEKCVEQNEKCVEQCCKDEEAQEDLTTQENQDLHENYRRPTIFAP